MNNFYGILKIYEISDIIFDYYNKCKLLCYIKCIDIDDSTNNSKIVLRLNENLFDIVYTNIKVDDIIFVYGKVVNNKKYNVIIYEINKI